ncbi:DUF6132 family protein [Pontibacter sp. G13]|uniref:DUF6132 family protein n=1 Tax=Pontibacter sp. G13 TaxID=3074898 RepID=UPI00288AF1E1|nr:DUF6132 family protein [Pontibacter sp. G13]WNJ16412.1 DUF6132 family protein [Pontibacter sp. G13]
MNFWMKYRFYFIGALVGAVGGFLYWNYVGCLSGTCSITSNWERMVPYGALMGGLLGGIVQDWVNDRARSSSEGSEV